MVIAKVRVCHFVVIDTVFIHVLVTNAHMYFELICHIVYFIPVAFKCSIVPLM